MEYSVRKGEFFSNALSQKARIKKSPGKPRQSAIVRKQLKPFSSSVIQDKKVLPSRKDIMKICSKLQLIKSKCMKHPTLLGRCDSRRTLQSQWLSNQALNESVDLDSDEDAKSSIKVKKAHLLRSPFDDRPPTVFFNYPNCCGIDSEENNRVYSIQKSQLTYRIYGSEYKCIVNSLQFNGFTKCDSGSDWNVMFDISGTHTKVLENMNRYQKMNHFPGCWMLGRKDYMWRLLNKMRRSCPEAYSFVPITYIFPSDFDRFQIIRESAQKNQLWIMKPSNAACGRGIRMVTKDTKIRNRRDYQISEYIANPHLINNHKYDLRIYVLATSYDPLKIFLFNEGLTRFATYQYTTRLKDIKKRFIHLTNFSVNRHSKKFVKNSQVELDGQGSKWSISALKRHYESNGIDSKALFEQIKGVIIKTCIAAEPVMLDIHSKTKEKRNCGFEIYGFDILVDAKLKPWLMEVNVCPSLSSSSPMDRRIKHTLLTDTLNLIGIEHYSRKGYSLDKKREKERFQFRQDKKYFSKNINNLESLDYSNCVEILSPEDWKVLFEAEEEMARCGNFQRIFPLRQNIDAFRGFFQFNRYNNHMLWKQIKSDRSFIGRLYE